MQHDFEILNSDANSGTAMRAAINAALQALATLSSGATAPSTTRAYMFWADTTTGLLKMRNAANSAWITITELAGLYLSTKGIKFPATQSPSADVNILDDYEEGAWTAAFYSAFGTITISNSFKTGWYVKIGKLVTFGGNFVVSSVSSPTGALTITGLPFTSVNDVALIPGVSLYVETLNAGMASFFAAVNTNATTITISGWAGAAATASTPAAPYMKANSEIIVYGSYIIS